MTCTLHLRIKGAVLVCTAAIVVYACGFDLKSRKELVLHHKTDAIGAEAVGKWRQAATSLELAITACGSELSPLYKAECLAELGKVLLHERQFTEAEAALTQSLALLQKMAATDDFSTRALLGEQICIVKCRLAETLLAKGDLAGSEKLYKLTLAAASANPHLTNDTRELPLNGYLQLLQRTGRHSDAQGVRKELNRIDLSEDCFKQFNIALNLYKEGKFAEADSSFAYAKEIADKRKVAYESGTFSIYRGLCAMERDAFPLADRHFRQVLSHHTEATAIGDQYKQAAIFLAFCLDRRDREKESNSLVRFAHDHSSSKLFPGLETMLSPASIPRRIEFLRWETRKLETLRSRPGEKMYLLASLATAYLRRNQKSEAKLCCLQALHLDKQIANSADDAETLCTLASVMQGVDPENTAYVERLLQKAAGIMHKANTDASSTMLQALAQLAFLQSKQQKDTSKTVSWFQQCLDRYQSDRDRKDTDRATLATLCFQLAALCQDHTWQRVQAEKLYKTALSFFQQQKRPDQHAWIACLLNDAFLLSDEHKQLEAAQAALSAAKLLEVTPDATTETKLRVASLLGTCANHEALRGYPTRARELFAAQLSIYEQLPKSQLPSYVAINYTQMADNYRTMNDTANAAVLFTRALHCFQTEKSPDKLHWSICLAHYGLLLQSLKQYGKATSCIDKAAELVLQAPTAIEVTSILSELANFYHIQHEFSKAEPLYEHQLSIYRTTGYKTPLATTCVQLADNYQEQAQPEKYAKAEKLFRQALELYQSETDVDRKAWAIALNHYAVLMQRTNRENEARKLNKEAQRILSKPH